MKKYNNYLYSTDEYVYLISKALYEKDLIDDVNGNIKCSDNKYSITLDTVQNIKMDVDGRVKKFDDNRKKHQKLIDEFISVDSGEAQREWEKKHPDIPFATDIPSYTDHMETLYQSMKKYKESQAELEKKFREQLGDWYDKLKETTNRKHSRDYEKEALGTLTEWGLKIKDHKKTVRSVPSYDKTIWSKQFKKNYLKSTDTLYDDTQTIKRTIRK